MKETTRAKFPYPDDNEVPDGPGQFKNLAERDEAMANLSGASNAKAVLIPEEKSRTNAAYGLLEAVEGRTDKVEGIVLPTKGLICVAYSAWLASSVVDVGRAAIFLGATQLRTRHRGTVAIESAPTGPSEAGAFRSIQTVPFGLVATRGAVNTGSADVTTGEAFFIPSDQEEGGQLRYDHNGTIFTIQGSHSGVCYIFANAGTYEVSVQFKSSSGSITAKERKLYVWTREFV
jgi:hypothetical protein